MKRLRKGSGSPVASETVPGEGQGSGSAELSTPERKRGPGKPFPKGVSGNPGGQSKEKRAFLDRLKTDDSEEVYRAFMALVRDGNPPAVLRAVEYLAGKPRSADEDLAAVQKAGVTALAVLSRDELLAIARGETP
ncbi:MAG: hypothetical protein ING90_19290 [Rhodocyclaceae bacterium]|nr:hypothetical protein [Rhodocyclaceae bacterium]